MRTAIISCQTMRKEVQAAMGQVNCGYPVVWIQSGLHDSPERLHSAIQDRIDLCTQQADRILMAMGFCGHAAVGLQSRGSELIFPKVDDCIAILCGGQRERDRHMGTYFLTEGWLQKERTIWHEYEYVAKKYGQDMANQVFQTMLHNYHCCALLDTGCFDPEPSGREVCRIAHRLGLEYQVIPGTISYLCDLLQGPWDRERFLTVPPHTELVRNMLYD